MSTVPFIPKPSAPRFAVKKGASPAEITAACTEVLAEHSELIEVLPKSQQIEKALKSGKVGARIWALHQVHNYLMTDYLERLDHARIWALGSGIVEWMVSEYQQALNEVLPLAGRTSFDQRKRLVDAIWAVRRMVQDVEVGDELKAHRNKGGHQKNGAKAAADRELRLKMRGKSGQKPPKGKRAA